MADELKMKDSPRPTGDELLSVTDVLNRLLEKKIWVATSIIVCAVLALAYLNVATYKHTISLKVVAVKANLESKVSGLNALKNFTGLGLSISDSDHRLELFLDQIKERQTTTMLSSDKEIMTRIFSKEWNPETKEWQDPGGLGSLIRFINSVVFAKPNAGWTPPDAARLQDFILGRIKVIRDTHTPIVNIQMLFSDPGFGKYFLSKLYRAADSAIRERALLRSKQNVSHLTKRLLDISMVEYRESIFGMLALEENAVMLASSDLPFAAEPLGQPVASADYDAPKPILVMIVAIILGATIGAFAVLLRFGLRNSRVQ